MGWSSVCLRAKSRLPSQLSKTLAPVALTANLCHNPSNKHSQLVTSSQGLLILDNTGFADSCSSKTIPHFLMSLLSTHRKTKWKSVFSVKKKKKVRKVVRFFVVTLDVGLWEAFIAPAHSDVPLHSLVFSCGGVAWTLDLQWCISAMWTGSGAQMSLCSGTGLDKARSSVATPPPSF